MTFSSIGPSSPRISVVMANYNGASHLAVAMQSVLSQSLSDLELVVIDDASTDESIAVITKIAAEDARVRPIYSPINNGPGGARNRGLDVARGDWIAVIDADDLFHPDRLARLVEFAETHGHPIVADDLIFFADSAGAQPRRLLQEARQDDPVTLSFGGLLADTFEGAPNHLGYVKPVIHRRALGALRYRSDLRVGEDFDLLLRLTATGHGLTVLPEAWYLYRRHAGSVSHRLRADDAAAMVRAMEALRGEAPPDAMEAVERRIAAMRRSAEEAAVLGEMKALRPARVMRRVIGAPRLTRTALNAAFSKGRARLRKQPRPEPRPSDLVLYPDNTSPPVVPETWQSLKVAPLGAMSSDDRARLTAATMDPNCTVHAVGGLNADQLGFVPDPARVIRYPVPSQPLVHVRTTTFQRPDALRRALKSIQAQTVDDWICDVYDDDPDRTGEAVVRELDDMRIRYTANAPKRWASANIDRCFTRFNPHEATYFCCLEDDNQLLPTFFEENILISELKGVEIVLRNQLVEYKSGSEDARLSATGLLETKFSEGVCDPETLHLSLMADWGVSNGGLFWSRRATSNLEIGLPCGAAMQEYLRTAAIVEPVYVALKPLAVWAENGDDTARDLGVTTGWLKRELTLKRSVQALQRHIWDRSSPDARRRYVEGVSLQYPEQVRATGLIKSLCHFRVGDALPRREVMRLLLRGMLIRLAGAPTQGLDKFLSERRITRRSRVEAALP